MEARLLATRSRVSWTCTGLVQGCLEEVVKGLFCVMTVVVGDMVVCTSPTVLSL